MFEKNNAGQYEQVSKLVASDATEHDYFGSALAAIDGLVLVGARGDDDAALGVGAENANDDVSGNSGAVDVFQKNSTTGQYEQMPKLVASDGDDYDWFGSAVAVTDSLIVVGAHGDDEAWPAIDVGSVYVYNYTNGLIT